MNEEQLEGSEPPRPQMEVATFEDSGSWAWVKGWSEPDAAAYYWANVELGTDVALKATRTYLARLQTAFAREYGVEHELRSYSTPGRGRFKATVFSMPSMFEQPAEVDLPNEGNPAHGETPKLPAKEKSEKETGRGESLPSEEA